MNHPSAPLAPRPGRPPRSGRPRRRSSGPARSDNGWLLLVFGLAVAGGLWWWMRQPGPAGRLAETAPAASSPVTATPDGPADGPVIDVPDRLPGVDGRSEVPEPSVVAAAEAPASAAARLDPKGGGAAERPAAVAVFPGVLNLDPVASASAEEVRLRDHTLAKAFETKSWSAYVAMLGQSLTAATQKRLSELPRPEEAGALIQQPVFRQLLVRQALLGELADRGARDVFDAPARRPFFEKLLSDPAMSESLMISLAREDKADAVIGTWADLWLQHETARTTHAELALACALVFEKPATLTWNDQPLRLTAGERFSWYVRQDAAGRLTGRINQMAASDLAWVVCAPVPESELDWAVKKIHLRQKSWGEAYSMIEYDMERAVRGTNRYDGYTLAEILKKGGICGDQTYFATNTARALGIPAAGISGDGARGPHAWFRWMDRDGEWREYGRFSGYALGTTTDAQTGRGMSEEWFVQRSERKATAIAAVREAYQRLWLGRLLEVAGDTRRAGPLIDLAAAGNRELPAVAEAQLRHWISYRAGAPLDEWRSLVGRLKKDFRENSALMALVQRAEDEVVFPRQDGKAVVADLRKDIRQLEKEAARDGAAPKDQDIAKSYARQAEACKKSGDLDGVRSVYRRALDDRSNAATFKVLALDYFRLLEGQPDARLRACRDLEVAWNRHVDTGGDYFDIGSQNSALSVIIDCYRQSGEDDKAARLQKELDRREDRSVRRAL